MFAQFEKSFLSTEVKLKSNSSQPCSFILLAVWCWASTTGMSLHFVSDEVRAHIAKPGAAVDPVATVATEGFS